MALPAVAVGLDSLDGDAKSHCWHQTTPHPTHATPTTSITCPDVSPASTSATPLDIILCQVCVRVSSLSCIATFVIRSALGLGKSDLISEVIVVVGKKLLDTPVFIINSYV